LLDDREQIVHDENDEVTREIRLRTRGSLAEVAAMQPHDGIRHVTGEKSLIVSGSGMERRRRS
jgi:hypothetical protein